MHTVQRFHHRIDGPQPAHDVRLGLLETGHDFVRKLEEEGLPLLGRLLLVREGELLVRAARQLNVIKTVLLELLAQRSAVLWAEAALLELDAVELDAQAEGGAVFDAWLDGVGDFKDDARAVEEGAAVVVRTLVRGWREKLGE